jgi:hypothetical protein
MFKRTFACVLTAAAFLAAASRADAQYEVPNTSARAVGETYWIEVMGGFWNPSPEGTIQSEQFGITSEPIDFVDDLEFPSKRFTDFRAVLHPGRKHKLRVQYVPVAYSSEPVLQRSIVFNGIRYDVGLPVNTEFEWKVWRFGYEYDFVSREKFFVGAILEAKYTQIKASLVSPVNDEFTSAKGPIPSVGGIARVYVIPNAAVTFEISGIKIPKIDDKYEAKYIDWDLYGTYNITKNFGVTAGYRVMDVMFLADQDGGTMNLKGLYFGGLARF